MSDTEIAVVVVMAALLVIGWRQKAIQASGLGRELHVAGRGAGLLAMAAYGAHSGLLAPLWGRQAALAITAVAVGLGLLWLASGWNRAAGSRDSRWTADALVVAGASAWAWAWLGKSHLSPTVDAGLRLGIVWLFSGAATRLLILSVGRSAPNQSDRLSEEPGYGKSDFEAPKDAARKLRE